MLVVITTAAALIVITVLIHGIGTTRWLDFLIRRHTGTDGRFRPNSPLLVISSTALLLVALHLIEIGLWAVTYRVLVPDQLTTFEQAAYFSAVTFTTLGYGDITLSSAWRILSGFEAIDGILLIGWTTAFLFAVLQKIWGNRIHE